jgi:hypothetical protein
VLQQRGHVGGVVFGGVVAFARPLTVTVASQVQGQHPVSGAHALFEAVPGVGLAAHVVQQDQRPRVVVAPFQVVELQRPRLKVAVSGGFGAHGMAPRTEFASISGGGVSESVRPQCWKPPRTLILFGPLPARESRSLKDSRANVVM